MEASTEFINSIRRSKLIREKAHTELLERKRELCKVWNMVEMGVNRSDLLLYVAIASIRNVTN